MEPFSFVVTALRVEAVEDEVVVPAVIEKGSSEVEDDDEETVMIVTRLSLSYSRVSDYLPI